jgi:phosphoadenosine phosphosulfate reductase
MVERPPQNLELLSAGLDGADPVEILGQALERYPQAALACSLGLEDVALVHMASLQPKPPRIFVLDTGRLHPETYDVLDALRQRYGLPIEVHFPQAPAVEAYVNTHGPNAFLDSVALRRECCRIRKVEPLSRALAGADAWITGLRRAQGPTRTDLSLFEADPEHGGIVKVSPLLNWSLADALAYVTTWKIPHNPLHHLGYPSIGCAPCTRAIEPGEDERAGRWWWENPDHKECGLHRRPTPGAAR